MDGINVDLHYLEQEVIEQTQADDKFLAVWYWNAAQGGTRIENNEEYGRLFGKTGRIVDYFYSDSPLQAMRARDLLQGV